MGVFLTIISSSCCNIAQNKNSSLVDIDSAFCKIDRPPLFNFTNEKTSFGFNNERIIVALFFEAESKDDCLSITKNKNINSPVLYSCTCIYDAK
jgi:hypothetical protein